MFNEGVCLRFRDDRIFGTHRAAMRRLPIAPSHSRNTSLTSTIVTSRYAIATSPQLGELGPGGYGRHVSGPGGECF